MENKQHKVIVFTSPSCSWCHKAKDYLKQNNIRFKDIDVSKDKQAMEDVVKKTGQMGVPVLLIDNKPVVGFDKKKIDRLLGLSK
ncbi:MAG: glutaredoxin family protein [bacterium]|nr:glutaredoxin family protein [bacterium]